MKDISASKKIGDKYKTLFGRKQGKYGQEGFFTPDFQREFWKWLQSQDGTYFNVGLKEFEPRNSAGTNTARPVEQLPYPDEVPF